jgi:hypothetical protein
MPDAKYYVKTSNKIFKLCGSAVLRTDRVECLGIGCLFRLYSSNNSKLSVKNE